MKKTICMRKTRRIANMAKTSVKQKEMIALLQQEGMSLTKARKQAKELCK